MPENKETQAPDEIRMRMAVLIYELQADKVKCRDSFIQGIIQGMDQTERLAIRALAKTLKETFRGKLN